MTVTSIHPAPSTPANAPAGWPLHSTERRGFASDNYSGAHPEVLAALAAANGGHQTSYGGDVYTARLQAEIERLFGTGVVAYPVFNGTGANVLSPRAMCRPWEGVICAQTANLNVDESSVAGRTTDFHKARRFVLGSFKISGR